MQITKLGHCCLLIETKGKKILTDPGMYSADAHASLTGIDFILYTHEHADHFHLESLKELLKKNPTATIYANVSAGDLLEKEDIPYTLVEHGSDFTLGEEIDLKGFGTDHAIIHESLGRMDNTGFLIDKRLWYPGDSFTNPDIEVEILALPVAGPWMKISGAIDYCLMLKPKIAFPVHDAIIEPNLRKSFLQRMPGMIFGKVGIEFVPLDAGETKEFY
jgi:L-ascorbate metabolism protein UlaG (beta-lactamase superfamily)